MTIGVAVVGSGFMGRTWANVTRLSLDATLRGVFGGRRAADLAADLACNRYDSLAELLEDSGVDLVIVTAPPGVHAEITTAAARASKSVLVEKPMAQSVAECEQMIVACRRAGVSLAVVSQHRFRESPRAAHQLLESGAIGEVSMVRVLGPAVGWWDVAATHDAWKLDPAQQSAYASWGAHACDLVRWLTGSEADLAFALFGQFSSEPPPGRSAMATYRFRSGAMAQLWMSYDVPPPGLGSGLQLLLVGEGGMIELDAYGRVRLASDGAWSVVHEQSDFDPLDPLDPMRLEAYAAELRDVIAAIAGGHPPIVSGEEGRATTEMLEAAELSARMGQAVPLPLAATP